MVDQLRALIVGPHERETVHRLVPTSRLQQPRDLQ
jgi:hypothetical protein